MHVTTMASISQLSTKTTNPTFPLSSSPCPFYSIPRTRISISGAAKLRITPPISCSTEDRRAHSTVDESTSSTNPSSKIDRRNVLLGLGGLYGATAGLASNRTAGAAPVLSPDPTRCQPPVLPPGVPKMNCCALIDDAIDFVPPSPGTPLRVRQAAHQVDAAYLKKFEEAMAIMRGKPDSDRRSFSQQAKVHCAYCDGAYVQMGYPDLEFQVHESWLFLPFHRAYLYFFERILGSLIGDESFAMPFWNWDTPEGMMLPQIYANLSSPLYDEKRDEFHQPPTIIDLDYGGSDSTVTDRGKIGNNLSIMYRQIYEATSPELFLGRPLHAGCRPNPGAGSVELKPHNTVHSWAGDRSQPNYENMGHFYSAGRDPVFYAHHSNIDRLWNVWRGLDGGRKDFPNADWLDTAFYFYDENQKLVKIRVRDVVDSTNLGYTYQDVGTPWLKTPPSVTPGLQRLSKLADAAVQFPVTLQSPVSVTVKRPKVSRSGEEVLVVEGIDLPDGGVLVKFDILINTTEYKKVGPGARELAGSFVNVPHRKGEAIKTQLHLALSRLLEDIKADAEDSVVVTLVPRSGKGKVTVGGLRIDLVS